MESTSQNKMRAIIDVNKCVACGCCAKVCPLKAIKIRNGINACIDYAKCVGCGKCSKECPASVIKIQEVSL